MNNEPLTSSDHVKLLTFFLLMMPFMFFLVGLIPAIFIVFGLYMMKKNGDFSIIDVTAKLIYYYIAILALGFMATFFIMNIFVYPPSASDNDASIFLILLGVNLSIALAAMFSWHAFEILFYRPLKEHKDWVVNNGFFSNEQKCDFGPNESTSSFKSISRSQHSTADEIKKLAELKDAGHISESEFSKEKNILLNPEK